VSISGGGKLGDIAGDHEYLMRAALKVNTIREDLGSVGSVIAKQIEEAMLGRRGGLDTSAAEAKAAKARKFVAAEKRLQERIARLHNTLLEAKNDFHLSPEHIERAVHTALALAERPPLKPVSLSGSGIHAFEAPNLTGTWAKALIGLDHPHTHERRPITFDHEGVKGRDDVVLVHLNHRLAQMCFRLLREEIWKLDDVKLMHRVTVRSVPDDALNRPAVAIWSRLVITGGNHHRLHEELTLAGGELKRNGFTRITQVGKLDALVNNAGATEPTQVLFDILKDRFQRQESAIMAAVEARSRERLRNLESSLERRKQGELEDVKTILDELESNLKNELNPDEHGRQLYLPGMSPEERNQITKDISALKARLLRIPEEREKESAAIEKHYSEPTDRTFPVAAIFLIPESLCGKI
jgi:hypothetical protein